MFIYFLVKAVITRLDIWTGVFVLFESDARKKAARAQFTGFEDYLSSRKKKSVWFRGKEKEAITNEKKIPLNIEEN